MNEETKAYLDQKFAAIDQQFATIDQQFVAQREDGDNLASMISTSFSGVEARIDTLSERLEPLAKQVGAHEGRLLFMENKLEKLAAS